MRLVIISGRSGSGKSTALNVLEDAGYYTIDNLPAGLLKALVDESLKTNLPEYERLGLCIDARSISAPRQFSHANSATARGRVNIRHLLGCRRQYAYQTF